MNRKPHVALLVLALLASATLAASAGTPGREPQSPSPGDAHSAPQVAPAPDEAEGVLAALFDDADIDGPMAMGDAGPGRAGTDDAHPGMGRGAMRARGGDCGMDCGAGGGPMAMRGMHRGFGPGAKGPMGHMGPMGRMGPMGHIGPMGGPRPFGRAGAAIGLTDAQREKLRDIHERQERHAVQARADIQIARIDLRHAMRAERPSATEIGTQIDRLAKLRADLAKSRVATMLEARAVLTPEQQKKLQDLRETGPGPGVHPGGGRGLGMGHGPGGAGDSQ